MTIRERPISLRIIRLPMGKFTTVADSSLADHHVVRRDMCSLMVRELAAPAKISVARGTMA